jgi:hypothetical protein
MGGRPSIFYPFAQLFDIPGQPQDLDQTFFWNALLSWRPSLKIRDPPFLIVNEIRNPDIPMRKMIFFQ